MSAKNGLAFEELINIQNAVISKKKLTTVSLFSGCGGLDLGVMGGFSVFANENKKTFSKNPFKVIWANDIDKDAVSSYIKNIGNHAQCLDINNIKNEDIPQCDIVIGGFPCQDFSIAGKMKAFENGRGTLYRQMIRVVQDKKPIAFIAENVKNILNPKLIDFEKNQPVIKTIQQDFENIGYKVKYKLLSATEYGIPQTRERVFIIGIRYDINAEFKFPASFHEPMTSKQAIDDLWGKEHQESIHNHNQISFAKFRPYSKVGSQGNEMIPENGPSHTMRAEHHMNIQAHYRTVSPIQDKEDRTNWRRLTVREAARLQTFPDSFNFIGQKGSTYKQVGNAVPPILGWYIARALAVCLKDVSL